MNRGSAEAESEKAKSKKEKGVGVCAAGRVHVGRGAGTIGVEGGKGKCAGWMRGRTDVEKGEVRGRKWRENRIRKVS